MDTSVLVNQAQELTRRLDETIIRPRAVMWVHSSEGDTWRLWIVPSEDVTDKHRFYRIVAETISKNPETLAGLDVGSVELASPSHPAMKGMARVLRQEGVGSSMFSGNTFDGFYLPDGVVIRMGL